MVALALAAAGAAHGQDLAARAVNELASPGPFLTQEAWADRLASALALGPALAPGATPDEVFALLCPARAAAMNGGRAASAELPRWNGGSGDVGVTVDVPRPGLYVVVVAGQGRQSWRAGGRDAGELNPTPWGVATAPYVVPLGAGPHRVVGSFESTSLATRVTLEPYRGVCVEPRDGWSAGQTLRFADKARTLVRALGLEARLPVEGPAEVVEAETFDASARNAIVAASKLSSPASAGAWARADGEAAELRWTLHVPEPGVVTLLARIHGAAAQVWFIGDVASRTVRPPPNAEGWVWTEIATLPLDAGVVTVRARIAPGAGVDVLRLQRRRDGDLDYLGVLDALGVREGAPDAPVDDASANANLSHPALRTLVAGFLRGLGGLPTDGLALVEHEQERLYTRPLSPLLPAEM